MGTKRIYWEVQGRNGYHAVDEHTEGESGVSGPVFAGSRKDAEKVAMHLNRAYAMGHENGMIDAKENQS